MLLILWRPGAMSWRHSQCTLARLLEDGEAWLARIVEAEESGMRGARRSEKSEGNRPTEAKGSIDKFGARLERGSVD